MSRQSIVSRIAHESFLHSPSSMPEGGPWWQYLESNFADRPEGFELEPMDWLRVNSTALADLVMRTWGGTLLTTTLPLGILPRLTTSGIGYAETLEDWTLYGKLVREGRGLSFFQDPPEVPVTTYDPRWGYFQPDDGRCIGVKFESPYVPYNERLIPEFNAHRNNRMVRARYWRHDDGPRPTLIAVHGFMADPYWLNERFFALQEFYDHGYDVILFMMPHHGLRREAGSLYSGQGFFASGLSGVNENMGQAICDLRVLMNWLRNEQGVTKLGATGVSLGGWTVSLLAAVEDSLEFVIPNVPVSSPVDLMMEWQPMGMLLRAGLFASRWSIKQLREVIAVTTPLTYKPKVPTERLMIIGGVGDRLAPPKHSRLLWDHWGRCRIHWFPGNHVLHLDRGLYIEQMLAFLRGHDFSWEKPEGVPHLKAVS